MHQLGRDISFVFNPLQLCLTCARHFIHGLNGLPPMCCLLESGRVPAFATARSSDRHPFLHTVARESCTYAPWWQLPAGGKNASLLSSFVLLSPAQRKKTPHRRLRVILVSHARTYTIRRSGPLQNPTTSTRPCTYTARMVLLLLPPEGVGIAAYENDIAERRSRLAFLRRRTPLYQFAFPSSIKHPRPRSGTILTAAIFPARLHCAASYTIHGRYTACVYVSANFGPFSLFLSVSEQQSPDPKQCSTAQLAPSPLLVSPFLFPPEMRGKAGPT